MTRDDILRVLHDMVDDDIIEVDFDSEGFDSVIDDLVDLKLSNPFELIFLLSKILSED